MESTSTNEGQDTYTYVAPKGMELQLANLRMTTFMMRLQREVGELHPQMAYGEVHPNAYAQGDTLVCISDTWRNTGTNVPAKKRKTPGLITIDLMLTRVRSRREGGASAELRRLCAIADVTGITLRLFPQHQSAGGMKTEDLIPWYKRHGFVLADGLYLVRLPRK